MYKQRHYPDNLEIVELDGVVNFQCNHLEMVISPKERYTYGYLPYVLTSKSLNAARRINMCVGSFNGKERLIGFACGLSYTMARNISYLEPLTKEFGQVERYPLFISLCVEKQYRRQSVGSGLLEIVIGRSHQQQFRTLVVDAGSGGNEAAHNFLYSHGFQLVQFPLLPGRNIFSLEL